MSTFTPIITKGPRSKSDPTPSYTLDLAEVTNGETFKSLGVGDRKTYDNEADLLGAVQALLNKYVTPSKDDILWDHKEHHDVPSAIVHISANPLAQQEELQGLR